MYKFNYRLTSNINIGNIKYDTVENSFDFLPPINSDIYILMNYLNLSFESTTMEAKSIWGFSPKKNWIEKKLQIPISQEGKIILEEECKSGMSYRYNNKQLKEFFDKDTNVYCIGNPEIEKEDKCIEFATNVVATITKRKELKNIYIICNKFI